MILCCLQLTAKPGQPVYLLLPSNHSHPEPWKIFLLRMDAREGKVSTSAAKRCRSDSNRKSNVPEPLLEMHSGLQTQSCRRKAAVTSQISTSEINPHRQQVQEKRLQDWGTGTKLSYKLLPRLLSARGLQDTDEIQVPWQGRHLIVLSPLWGYLLMPNSFRPVTSQPPNSFLPRGFHCVHSLY